MGDHFLQLKSVCKSFGEFKAVNDISLSIRKGSIFGLLGPNGAGKTTLIRMITAITAPDSGEIFVDGHVMNDAVNNKVGYMPEERGHYKKMKVGEQLVYLLRLKGLTLQKARERIEFWLHRLQLADWTAKPVSELSKGMQQKIQFIATVAHEPTLLILDEPFSGLDPINSLVIETEIRRLRDEGTTIIFSTHRMEQVEELCTEIALVNKGRVILNDQVTEARKRFDKKEYDIEFTGPEEAVSMLPGTEIISRDPGRVRLRLTGDSSPRILLQTIANSELEIRKFEHHLPRLSEIFIDAVTAESN